jgi:hypothetical protein
MTRSNAIPFQQLGSRVALIACLAAGSTIIGCTATGRASAEVAAPAPGLVAVGPDVWVVGDTAAPEAYYVDGYYWESEGDHWYRRPNPQVAWVVVETRVVPERVIIHEREHHTAIVAHHRPLTNVEAVREKQATARERATEQQARERTQDADARQREDVARDRQERHEAAQAEAKDDRAENQERAAQRRAELAAERERRADVAQKHDQRDAENDAARREAQEKQKAERERIEKEAQAKRERERQKK